MRFTKKDGIYRIILLSGAQDNILGVSFDESNSNKIQTSKEEVLEQVLCGLESVNKSLDTSYKLSKIYFLPSDRASNSVYKSFYFS